MGFLRFHAVFLVAILQQQMDCFIVPYTKSDFNCPPKSHVGTASICNLSCGNVDYTGRMCIALAVPGCQCDHGLLAQTGTSGESIECVTPEDCKAACGPNKHYDPSAPGCQPTCENPSLPEVCDFSFVPKCVCNKGYILSERSKYSCVKPNECNITQSQP